MATQRREFSTEVWKDIVTVSGPGGLRLIKGFHDEALRGEWKGHRSSRLGLQFRVIYQVVASKVLVKVVDVTAHDYRRKWAACGGLAFGNSLREFGIRQDDKKCMATVPAAKD